MKAIRILDYGGAGVPCYESWGSGRPSASDAPVQLSPRPLGLLAEEKASISGLAAVMREAQKVEHLRPRHGPAPMVFFSARQNRFCRQGRGV
jgi:hypothetical protein